MSVVSVSISSEHSFTKPSVDSIHLIKGIGIEGDCHSGATIQHLSRMKKEPAPENLRQVHLMPLEILSERQVNPGQIGENVTTEGLDLLKMSTGTKLTFVPAEKDEKDGLEEPAVVILTGLRNPCWQIDKFRKGLQETFLVRDEHRKITGRKAGVMSIVERGGIIKAGMKILVEEPGTFTPMGPV